jgi:hypothetical protein
VCVCVCVCVCVLTNISRLIQLHQDVSDCSQAQFGRETTLQDNHQPVDFSIYA